MAKAKYSKEQLIADHKTGGYSQRELAKKYGVSVGTVNGLTRGIEQENEHLVQKKLEVYQLSTELPEKELNAVEQVFNKRLLEEEERRKQNDFLSKGVLQLANISMKKIMSGVDMKTGEGITSLDLREVNVAANTFGIASKVVNSDKASTVINNTNAQQNNGKLVELTDDELIRIASGG